MGILSTINARKHPRMDKSDLEVYVGKTVYIKLVGNRFAAGLLRKITTNTIVLDRGGEGYESRAGELETYQIEDVTAIRMFKPSALKSTNKLINELTNKRTNEQTN